MKIFVSPRHELIKARVNRYGVFGRLINYFQFDARFVAQTVFHG